VSLPAWSVDGKTIIYLQKSGRKKYSLMQIDVVH
jgi:Tol biopolymer transport system component